MTKLQILPLSGLIIMLAATSCERKEITIADVGGKGGRATLRVTPRHHAPKIDSCLVYIKYNTSDAAASYDDSAWCVPVNGSPVATFAQLKKGNYYVYARGYDPGVLIDPVKWWNVHGGISYTIQSEQTINMNVPVSEPGH